MISMTFKTGGDFQTRLEGKAVVTSRAGERCYVVWKVNSLSGMEVISSCMWMAAIGIHTMANVY